MKRAILATTILLLAMAFAFQTTVTVYGDHTADITIEPEFGSGEYPEWKNFTVNVQGPDPVLKVVITYPEIDPEIDQPFEPVEYDFPDGWTATPEPALHQVIFEGEGFTGEEEFKIKFRDGPKDEGVYTFIVSTTDEAMDAYTEYIDQFIDTTPPTVVITYPGEGDTIEGDVWINATISDNLCLNTSSVGLYLNEALIVLPMDYEVVEKEDDRITKIKAYWYSDSLPMGEGLYLVLVNATDCAGNPGEDSLIFTWKPIRLIIKPESGTACPTTKYNIKTRLYTGIPFTYGMKELGTKVTVSGGGFTENSKVDVTVVHPLWGEILVVNDAPTDDTGYFESSFRFPTAPCGIYQIRAEDAEEVEPLEPGWFTIIPEVVYKPEIVIGPAVIEVRATGLTRYGYVSRFMVDGTDALLGTNQQTIFYWNSDVNGTLQTTMAEKPGFLMPVMEPGTYEVNMSIYDGWCWDGTADEGEGIWMSRDLEVGNKLRVVNDFGGLMDAIDDLELKLDDIKPRVKDIQDRVIIIETTVGEIKATLDELDPIIREIKDEVVTIETAVGSIEVKLDDIKPVVESIDDNVVDIHTTVGNIKGTVTSIKGDVATVKTDVGEVDVKADLILEELPEPAPDVTLSMNLATVLSAIAAIASITAVAVVLRRLRVAA